MNTLALRFGKPWTASPTMRETACLCLVIATTLGVELALVERKYAILGGGFGQSQALSGGGGIAAFAALTVACHALLLTLLFLVLRALHRRLGKSAVFPINFLVLVPVFAIAGLAAKYEVLSYFSDAISFELIRNLGGGSLFDALLFVLSEGALMAGGAVAGLGLYWFALRWHLRRRSVRPVRPRPGASVGRADGRALVEGPAFGLGPGKGKEGLRRAQPERVGLRIGVRALLIWLFAVAGGLYLANQRVDLRSALGRFNAPLLIKRALAQVTDFDRDGYGLLSHPADPWPFDGVRYPFALDIPGNGVDEDGLGGDFSFAGGAASEPAKVALPAKPKHLVLIVLESTRGDVIGRRFAGRAVTPHLNALAAGGSSFPAAYSHVGFTTASLKSLFSGRLETRAGGPSLFRDLKDNGYRIGVFSGQPESFGDISEAVGMRAAADVFQDAETLKAERAFGFAAKGSLLVDGKVLLREFDRSFGRHEAWQQPVFLYVNLQSAHFPYHNPQMEQILPGRPIPRAKIALANRKWVEATYWNAVAQADAQIGALIARLKALDVYDDSLLVVTADHGESLFDDGFLGHGHMLNRQQTHIPLVVNVAGVARTAPVGLADYRRLILRLLGADVPAQPAGPVLQYIGTLDRPSFVGMVEAGERWTVLEVHERRLSFSEVSGSHLYEGLGARPSLKARADRLIALWERERWLASLRKD